MSQENQEIVARTCCGDGQPSALDGSLRFPASDVTDGTESGIKDLPCRFKPKRKEGNQTKRSTTSG